jgi:hypothetical protein
MKKLKTKQKHLFILIFLMIAMVVTVGWWIIDPNKTPGQDYRLTTSSEAEKDCMNAGGVVLQSYPPICHFGSNTPMKGNPNKSVRN